MSGLGKLSAERTGGIPFWALDSPTLGKEDKETRHMYHENAPSCSRTLLASVLSECIVLPSVILPFPQKRLNPEQVVACFVSLSQSRSKCYQRSSVIAAVELESIHNLPSAPHWEAGTLCCITKTSNLSDNLGQDSLELVNVPRRPKRFRNWQSAVMQQ